MTIIKDVILLVICIVFGTSTCQHVTSRDLSKVMATYRENMTDTGKPFVEYDCTAEMDAFNRLSWYKIKGKKHTLLRMTQHQNKGKANKTMTLHMTLEGSDQNSEVYCLKEKRTKQSTIYQEVVRWIQLSFTRPIPTLEKAQACIEPKNKVVYFDAERTVSFVCRGTAPTDGRKLTWYFENYDHSEQHSEEVIITPVFEIVESQTYDSVNHKAVLNLKINKAHHLKRLFCAQDMHLEVKEANGDSGIVRYAQRVRSHTITLIRHNFNSSDLAGTPFSDIDNAVPNERMINNVPWWSTALLAVLALMLFIALAVVIKKLKKTEAEFEEKERLWNREPIQVPNENHYAAVYDHGAGLLRRPKK